MTVYLIRHAQTAWNVNRRAQGHADIPLDELGRKQAALLGDAFRKIRLDAIHTSDLARSFVTAEHIREACGSPLTSTSQLRERSFGEWEGEPYERIQAGMLASAMPAQEFVPPGGESMVSVQKRLTKWWESLGEVYGDLAIVSHGGSCSLLLANLLGAPPVVSKSFAFANTGVTELRRRDDGIFRLVRYNCTQHLQEVARESAYGVIG